MAGMIDILPKDFQGKQGWPWTVEANPNIYAYRNEWPKISIVTPSFNQAQYLEETIRSILLQNYPNLEYIIIDGGSTDETIRIIKKYERWISCWVSEKDGGQSNAINKGISKCTGEIFNWINSDDFLSLNCLFDVAESFLVTKNTEIVCFRTILFNKESSTVNNFTPVYRNLLKTIGKPSVNQMGMFWRLKRVTELNGVNENLHYSMDLDLWLRYLVTFGIDNVKLVSNAEPVGYFRLHPASKTVSESVKNESLFDTENFEIYRRLKLEKSALSTVFSYYYYHMVISDFYKNDGKNFYNLLFKINPIRLDIDDVRDLIYLLRKKIFV